MWRVCVCNLYVEVRDDDPPVIFAGGTQQLLLLTDTIEGLGLFMRLCCAAFEDGMIKNNVMTRLQRTQKKNMTHLQDSRWSHGDKFLTLLKKHRSLQTVFVVPVRPWGLHSDMQTSYTCRRVAHSWPALWVCQDWIWCDPYGLYLLSVACPPEHTRVMSHFRREKMFKTCGGGAEPCCWFESGCSADVWRLPPPSPP